MPSQASLVSLRKIVNKPEKRDEDDKVARLEHEKASLESKNIELANALRVIARMHTRSCFFVYLNTESSGNKCAPHTHAQKQTELERISRFAHYGRCSMLL
jgi:hypothetical protein